MSVSASANISCDEDSCRESLTPYLSPHFLDRDFHLEAFAEYRASYALYKAFTPCCLVLGLVGNCGSVVVLLCGRMPRSTTFTYMVALATCDALSEVINLVFYAGKHVDDTLYARASCGLVFFLFLFSVHSSVLLTVAMTVERYLILKYPLKASCLFTVKRARLAVGTVGLVSFLLNAHSFFTRRTVWSEYLHKHICDATGEPSEFFLYKVWPWIDGSVYCYLPFGALLVMNILIFKQIKTSDQVFSELNIQCTKWSNRRSRESRQITVMLLMVTLAFLILVGPLGVVLVVEQRILTTGNPVDRARLSLIRTVFGCLTYVNHAVNFFLYFLNGGHFRKEALRLFCLRNSNVKTSVKIIKGSVQVNQIDTILRVARHVKENDHNFLSHERLGSFD